MSSFTYTNARENLAKVIDLAISGEPVEITRRGGGSAMVISKASFESYRKAMLDAEFMQLVGQFDETNKALTNK